MGNTLFSNVRIFDGSGELPYFGEVLIQGNRIKHVGRGSRTVPANGHTVIDGAGATLMPGLTEAHTHLSWNNAPSLDAIFRMPPEEHTLFSANAARTYIDMGWTSCVGAAAAKPRLDVVIRNAINSGLIQGPRYLANSQEIATLGGLGDTTPPHVDVRELSFGWVVTGPEEMRKAVRMFIKYGVDLIKLNRSGEEMTDTATQETPMADEEAAMAVRQDSPPGPRGCAHARPPAIRRVGQDVHPPRHRDRLARLLCRRGSTGHVGGEQEQAFRGARVGLAGEHGTQRRPLWHQAGLAAGHLLRPRARDRGRDHAQDAPPRHPCAARRRLWLRLDAPRHQRQGLRVFRRHGGHVADGSAPGSDQAWRRDHGPAQ